MEKKIYTALTSIIGEVNAIGKNQRNQQQNFAFRGIDDVMNELHTLFGRYKVIIIPEVVDYNVSEKTTNKGTIMYITRSTVKFHFVAEDGSEVVTTNVGEAMDSADKGMNKTMSCALKYALMQMFLIPTKETEDADRVTPPDTIPSQSMNIDREIAINDVKNAKTSSEVEDLWHQHKWLHKDKEFYDIVAKRGSELKKQEGVA